MNFKNNFGFIKKLSAITWLMVFVVSSFIFQGCEKDDHFSPEKNAIIKSTEFEDFIAANMALFSAIEQAKAFKNNPENMDTAETIELEQGVIVRSMQFKTEKDLLKNALEKGEVFLKKHPSFSTYREEEVKDLVFETLATSMPLNEFMFQENLMVRLKSGNIEAGSSGHDYSGFWNAFNYVINYMATNGAEAGGYIYQGGGALIYLNPHATANNWGAPGPITITNDVSYYNGNAIQATFHTHNHSGSHLFSTKDFNSMRNHFPNCDLIILYNSNAYVYSFSYGNYIP